MPALPMVLAGIGAVGQGAATILSANARADAAAADAAAKRAQADELHQRELVAEADLSRVEGETVGAQKDVFGYTGFASNSGMLLSALEQTRSRAQTKLAELRRDATFREQQLRQGADISSALGDQAMSAGIIGAGGSFAGNVYNIGSSQGWWTPKKQNIDLPDPGRGPASVPWAPFGTPGAPGWS